MRRAVGRAFRETGQAMDRLGLTVSGTETFKDTISRHRPVQNLFDKRPVLAADVFVAPNASVIGDVLCYDRSSVWYGAVVRGDKNKVRIGRVSTVLDRAVLTTVTKPSVDNGFPSDLNIGSYVTVGQGAVLTSCTIGDGTQIEAGSIVQEGSVVESNCIIAAGSVVLPGTFVPAGQFWAGNPARYIRDVAEEEQALFEKNAEATAGLALQHAEEFLPFGTAYQEAEARGL